MSQSGDAYDRIGYLPTNASKSIFMFLEVGIIPF